MTARPPRAERSRCASRVKPLARLAAVAVAIAVAAPVLSVAAEGTLARDTATAAQQPTTEPLVPLQAGGGGAALGVPIGLVAVAHPTLLGEVDLAWVAPPGETREAGVRIGYYPTAQGFRAWAWAHAEPTRAASMTVADLDPGTRYTFHARAAARLVDGASPLPDRPDGTPHPAERDGTYLYSALSAPATISVPARTRVTLVSVSLAGALLDVQEWTPSERWGAGPIRVIVALGARVDAREVRYVDDGPTAPGEGDGLPAEIGRPVPAGTLVREIRTRWTVTAIRPPQAGEPIRAGDRRLAAGLLVPFHDRLGGVPTDDDGDEIDLRLPPHPGAPDGEAGGSSSGDRRPPPPLRVVELTDTRTNQTVTLRPGGQTR